MKVCDLASVWKLLHLPVGACGHLYSRIPERKEPDLNEVPKTTEYDTY